MTIRSQIDTERSGLIADVADTREGQTVEVLGNIEELPLYDLISR